MNLGKIIRKFEKAESDDDRLQRIDLDKLKLDAEMKQRKAALDAEEREARAAIMQEVSKPTAEQEAADKKAYEVYREPAVRVLRLNKFLSDPKTRKSSAYSDKEQADQDERLIEFYLSSRFNTILELFADPAVIIERLDEVDRLQKEQAKWQRDQEKKNIEREKEGLRLQAEREEEKHRAELEEAKKYHYSGPLPDCSPRP